MTVENTYQIVHVRINDPATGRPTAVRISFLSAHGEYIAPLGRLKDFAVGWNEDVGDSVMIGDRRFAYIDGSCEIRLPAGPIQIEVWKGSEYKPIHHLWERKPGQISLRLNIERQFDFQREGWYAGDTQAFYLSPHAAGLEGAAEGLHVVNMLAAEWNKNGRHFLSNILEFSGQQPAYSRDDCSVVVNTQNRHWRLGDISLLNCHRPVFPLTSSEHEFSDWTLEDWCGQCHRKGGLVVWPNFPRHIGERENLLPGHIDAIEWTAGGNFETAGLAEWYRLLNAGHRLPLVGGSGKMSNAVALGAVRTYAKLETGAPFNYQAWIEAIRTGGTFITAGPLVRLTANEQGPGCVLSVTESGPVHVNAESMSVTPYERLEIVLDGEVIGEARPDVEPDAQARVRASLACASGSHPLAKNARWLAARCYDATNLCLHTSPIYIVIQ